MIAEEEKGVEVESDHGDHQAETENASDREVGVEVVLDRDPVLDQEVDHVTDIVETVIEDEETVVLAAEVVRGAKVGQGVEVENGKLEKCNTEMIIINKRTHSCLNSAQNTRNHHHLIIVKQQNQRLIRDQHPSLITIHQLIIFLHNGLHLISIQSWQLFVI